jgi:hypothetical protein
VEFGFGFSSALNGSVSGFGGTMNSETTIIDVENNAYYLNRYLELNHYHNFSDAEFGTATLTFSGNVSSLVLPSTLADGGKVQVFVKTFNPGYAGLSGGEVFQDLTTDGSFSITTSNPAGGPTQVGFLILDHANTTGLGLTPASFDFDSLSVIVPVPEPTTFALAGLGTAALLIFRRRS